jgi:hypothetical protein
VTHTRTHTNAKPAAPPRTQRDSAQDYLSLAVLPWPLGAFASRKGSRVLLTSACNHCLQRRCSWCHRFLTLEHVGLQAGDKDIHSSHAGPRVLGWRRRRRRRRRRGGGVKGHRTLGLLPLGLWRRLRLAPVWRRVPWGGWGGGDSPLTLILDTGGGRGRTHTATLTRTTTHTTTQPVGGAAWGRGRGGGGGGASSLVLRLDLRWECL